MLIVSNNATRRQVSMCYEIPKQNIEINNYLIPANETCTAQKRFKRSGDIHYEKMTQHFRFDGVQLFSQQPLGFLLFSFQMQIGLKYPNGFVFIQFCVFALRLWGLMFVLITRQLAKSIIL